MDDVLNGVNKMNTNVSTPGEGEMEFVYNILVPDFLLFTICMSLGFVLLIHIFN